MEQLISTALLLLVVGLIVWGNWRSKHHWVVAGEHATALLLRDGAYSRTLAPGRHWLHKTRDVVVQIGTQTRITAVRGQEVLSQDGIVVKANLDFESKVVDARRVWDAGDSGSTYLLNTNGVFARISSRASDLLRDSIARREFEAVLADREAIANEVRDGLAAYAQDLGVELEGVFLRDIMLPGAIKRLLAANVQARMEGIAALERARAEHAAMRSLANTARLVSQHPELTKLRLIQEMSNAERPTFVVGVDTAAPLASATVGSHEESRDE